MAHWEMSWLIRRCGGSLGDVVALQKIWWLTKRCGSSLEDVEAYKEIWYAPDF